MTFSENHQRHYFEVPLPEELCNEKETKAYAFMDVRIEDDKLTGPTVIVDNWGIVFENQVIQPDWVTPAQLEREKTRVHFRIRKR